MLVKGVGLVIPHCLSPSLWSPWSLWLVLFCCEVVNSNCLSPSQSSPLSLCLTFVRSEAVHSSLPFQLWESFDHQGGSSA
jgi:hypothetical protein